MFCVTYHLKKTTYQKVVEIFVGQQTFIWVVINNNTNSWTLFAFFILIGVSDDVERERVCEAACRALTLVKGHSGVNVEWDS